jgi:transcriptional regulator with GAF, ATPase, and Fis domain
VRRAWAKLDACTVETADDLAVPRYPYGVEVPVDLAGDICGTVGLETAEPVNGLAHQRAAAVADLLATWEARRRLGGAAPQQTIVGCSAEIRRVELLARRYAALDEPVLIQGETGVGKELFAQTLHCLSPRSTRPLCTINCAAVPDELIASELFGHRRGAFTGAVRDQRGRFEMADGATLFLDEVGGMGPGLQVALLRVMEHGEIQQLGDEGRMRRINVRVIAASNRDLAAEVAAGRFRSDLYYRLTPLTIDVPPLRQRPEDIPVLARYFVSVLEESWGQPLEIAAVCCEGRIESIPLPHLAEPSRSHRPVPVPALAAAGGGPAHAGVTSSGNGSGRANGNGHRALRSGDVYPAPDLAVASLGSGVRRVFPKANDNHHGSRTRDSLSLDGATAAHLRKVLTITRGNISQAARMLEMPRTTLQSKLRRYGVD